jgi:hypothetical protein
VSVGLLAALEALGRGTRNTPYSTLPPSGARVQWDYWLHWKPWDAGLAIHRTRPSLRRVLGVSGRANARCWVLRDTARACVLGHPQLSQGSSTPLTHALAAGGGCVCSAVCWRWRGCPPAAVRAWCCATRCSHRAVCAWRPVRATRGAHAAWSTCPGACTPPAGHGEPSRCPVKKMPNLEDP